MQKRVYPNIKTYMQETGASQKEIAMAVGSDPGTISRIVRGLQRPSLALALKIANAANIPVESLNVDDSSG